jgi:hypothetical protein
LEAAFVFEWHCAEDGPYGDLFWLQKDDAHPVPGLNTNQYYVAGAALLSITEQWEEVCSCCALSVIWPFMFESIL